MEKKIQKTLRQGFGGELSRTAQGKPISEADSFDLAQDKWKKELTKEEYHVMREKGTEPPFTGEYFDSKEKGVYRCKACGNPLFKSDAKFDSRTGWPSFVEPLTKESVKYHHDRSLGMERIEVTCGKCGAHLGHVFDDGPAKMPDGKPATGKRYCINSICLDLEKNDQGPRK